MVADADVASANALEDRRSQSAPACAGDGRARWGAAGPEKSPFFVASAPRCRGGAKIGDFRASGPHGLKDAEGVVDTSLRASPSKRLEGVRPATAATSGARSDRLASAAGNRRFFRAGPGRAEVMRSWMRWLTERGPGTESWCTDRRGSSSLRDAACARIRGEYSRAAPWRARDTDGTATGIIRRRRQLRIRP